MWLVVEIDVSEHGGSCSSFSSFLIIVYRIDDQPLPPPSSMCSPLHPLAGMKGYWQKSRLKNGLSLRSIGPEDYEISAE